MIEIREVGADGWPAMRDIRLAALRDDPQAFASTYEREAAFAEADWQRRIAGGGSFLAYAPELGPGPAGIAGGFESGPGTVELVSMWVRPQARGRGIGQALVGAVAGWAGPGARCACTCGWPRTTTMPACCTNGAASARPPSASRCRPAPG